MFTQARLMAAIGIALGVIAAYYVDANVFRLPRF